MTRLWLTFASIALGASIGGKVLADEPISRSQPLEVAWKVLEKVDSIFKWWDCDENNTCIEENFLKYSWDLYEEIKGKITVERLARMQEYWLKVKTYKSISYKEYLENTHYLDNNCEYMCVGTFFKEGDWFNYISHTSPDWIIKEPIWKSVEEVKEYLIDIWMNEGSINETIKYIVYPDEIIESIAEQENWTQI